MSKFEKLKDLAAFYEEEYEPRTLVYLHALQYLNALPARPKLQTSEMFDPGHDDRVKLDLYYKVMRLYIQTLNANGSLTWPAEAEWDNSVLVSDPDASYRVTYSLSVPTVTVVKTVNKRDILRSTGNDDYDIDEGNMEAEISEEDEEYEESVVMRRTEFAVRVPIIRRLAIRTDIREKVARAIYDSFPEHIREVNPFTPLMCLANFNWGKYFLTEESYSKVTDLLNTETLELADRFLIVSRLFPCMDTYNIHSVVFNQVMSGKICESKLDPYKTFPIGAKAIQAYSGTALTKVINEDADFSSYYSSAYNLIAKGMKLYFINSTNKKRDIIQELQAASIDSSIIRYVANMRTPYLKSLVINKKGSPIANNILFSCKSLFIFFGRFDSLKYSKSILLSAMTNNHPGADCISLYGTVVFRKYSLATLAGLIDYLCKYPKVDSKSVKIVEAQLMFKTNNYAIEVLDPEVVKYTIHIPAKSTVQIVAPKMMDI